MLETTWSKKLLLQKLGVALQDITDVQH